MSIRVLNRYLFALLILFVSHQTFPQNNNIQFPSPVFEAISSENGLPENSVTCILQDHLGYLWLGTQNGLVRYDGYFMKVFQPDKNESSSISGGSIITIYEDKNKILWVGTYHGLNKFDRDNETFESFKYDPKNNRSINDDVINCIYEDASGNFWVGTNRGLNLFDRDKQIFSQYYFRDSDLKLSGTSVPGYHYLIVNSLIEEPCTKDLLVGTSAAGLLRFTAKEKLLSKYKFNSSMISDEKIGTIQSFYKSRDGKIWIVSSNTLSGLDPQKKECKSYIEFSKNKQAKFDRGTVIEDHFGLIWCGFWALGKGVLCLNPKTGSFKQYKIFPEKQVVTDKNRIYSLYEDRSGIIWIGTWLSGLMKWDRRKYKFQVLKNEPENTNSISDSKVYHLNFDPKGYIWFATPKALDKFNFYTAKFHHFLNNNENITENVYHFITDKSGDIWMGGTLPGGLIKFSPADGTYHSYFNDPKDSLNLNNKKIMCLFQDHFGILWLGTEYSGLYSFDIKHNKLKHYVNNPNDPSSLRVNRVLVIFEDSFGSLWIGTTEGGFGKFDRNSDKFIYSGLSTIMEIFEDKRKNFWVADYFSGLNLFDRKKNKITATYGVREGLAHNAIQGISEDDHENLWIGTDVGLSKFSIKTKSFRNYTTADGLPANRFLWPCCKDANGVMYFNTEGGIIYFHPDSIKDDPVSPKVVLSNVSLFNRPGEKLNYKGFISELKEIILNHDQNDLRFDYVGLHFSEPVKNRYKYILGNFDEDWVDAGTQRNATYTNLDPGNYIFRVKAANKDGVWNDRAASLKIIIQHPWWATLWAYIVYIILGLGVAWILWKMQLNRIRTAHEIEMSRFEADKLHEVDTMKSTFFTNISHEFRTPLTLILGPALEISEKIKDGRIKEELKIIHKNARKLLDLVNQLLDISKIESGNMQLQAAPINIIPFLRALLLSFSSYAERKRIKLTFNADENEVIVYIDREKFEKIFTNILSNAFKFTPEEGRIQVSVLTEEEYLKITIQDSGIGIPKEHLEGIFKRFYQVNNSLKTEMAGTGIGLSLTKELVELHKGKIKVESEEGKGTEFTVSLPLGKAHLKPEEICRDAEDEDPDLDNKIIIPGATDEISYHTKTGPPDTGFGKPVLLVVEDNSDVMGYIINNLINDYRILSAGDGLEGWEKSVKYIPDLIISDVMMPKMDGIEFCEKIKADERTSHIPVILLTAKAASQDKIEGYETGADDYIMKPFETSELRARISNLIQQRQRIHEHFRKQGLFEISPNVAPLDQKFLQKVFNIISEHISDPGLNAALLISDLGMSRSVLHRKITSLLGETPGELIRTIRLKTAARLIETKAANISEIALDVGFANPAYFSECFKKQFGMAPSQYQQKFTENSLQAPNFYPPDKRT